MADVKWIKVLTDVFDDEKILLIETLPDADGIIVIWFKLLCLAGKQNNSGVFIMNNGMPYTEKMLATIFRRKESTVAMALDTFRQFGMVEIIDDTLTIPNWGKHQNLDKIEAKNQYMKKYMADYRCKQKSLACKTNSKTNSIVNVNSADKIRLDKNRDSYYYSHARGFILGCFERYFYTTEVTDFEIDEIIVPIKSWFSESSVDEIEEVICDLFESAVKAGVKNINYIKGIYKVLSENGVKNTKDYWQYQVDHDSKMKG